MRKEVGFSAAGVPVLLNLELVLRLAFFSIVSLAGMACFFAWLGRVPPGSVLPEAIVLGAIGGPATILIHEVGHALMARVLGMPSIVIMRPGQMRTYLLLPTQASARPGARITISLAGPLVTAVQSVCLLGFAVWYPSISVRIVAGAASLLLAIVCVGSVRGTDGRIAWHAVRQVRNRRSIV